MSAPSKRRHLLYYLSLPVVAAVVVLLATRLVAMQRAEIIAELTEQIAHSEPSEASAAVRQLGEMPSPPAAVLVSAATGGDSKVAREAQQTIDRVLRRWQRQVDAGRGLRGVSRGLVDLADALAAPKGPLTLADREWIIGTTQRIVSLANRMPAKHTPTIAITCDSILASQSAVPNTQTVPATDQSVNAAPRELDAAESDALHANVGKYPETDIPEENPLEEYHRADWTRPVFRMLPVERNSPNLKDEAPSAGSPLPSDDDRSPAEIDTSLTPFAKLDSRDLLKRWRVAEGSDLAACEEELTRHRGFRGLSKSVVDRLFSDQVQDRVQLVDDVLKTPGVDARPWLTLLADDASADVRLAAVSVMATSSDPGLVEKAWQTAIRDRDPRIASLASRLRERRSAIQRR